MLNFFKKVFSQPESEQAAAAPANPQPPTPAPASKPAPAPAPASKPAPAAAAPAPAAKPASPTPAPAPAAPAPVPSTPVPQSDGETIHLLLTDIVGKLPPNLAPAPSASLAGTFPLPVKTALAQLPTGAVKVRYGDLRDAAAPGTFSADASHNDTMINLPLPKILAAMNPAMLTRRAGQKQIEVPLEITGVFGGKDKGGNQVATAAAPSATPAPMAAPKPDPVVAAGNPVLAALGSAQVVPPPAPAPVEPEPEPERIVMVKPIGPPPTPAMPKPQKPPPSFASAPPAPKPPAPAPLPFATQKPVAPATPSAPLPFATQKPVAPVPAPSPAPAPVAPVPSPAPAGGSTVLVKLSAISEAWAEPVRQEIEQAKLKDASVALPMSRLDAAMKTGRIAFKWSELIQWLDVGAPASSPNGDTSVELPLKVVAPLYMAQRKPATEQKKVAIGENIPNLFEGLAKPVQAPEIVAAPAAAPAPAPSIAAAPPAPVPISPIAPIAPISPIAAPAPPASVLGEIFGQPAKKDWSPQEIAQKINSLPGVSGSIIAMSDGLHVAGELPAPLKSETLAAFLPQMFGRMNHYSGEIQLGSLSTLTMQAGETTCAIYKTGALYLAVLGKSGETLPLAALQRVAGELAKRSQ